MRPVVVSLVTSLVAAPALSQLIASQLYQTSGDNPLLLAITMSILGLAALFACVFSRMAGHDARSGASIGTE
jgi:hypothetical protein